MVMPLRQPPKLTFMQRLGRVFKLGNWMGAPNTGYLPAGQNGNQPVNSAYYQAQNNYAVVGKKYTPVVNTSRPGQYNGTPPEDQEAARQIIKIENVGAPGTHIYAGYIHEDYLHELQGHERADIFDQIRRSDYQAQMLLTATKSPLLGATYEVEPADDSPEQQTMAEFIKFLLFEDMEQSWTEFLTELYTFPDFGYALFEMTDKVVLNHPRWGNYNGIKQLAWRSPRTIHRFNVEPKDGKLLSVSQYVYGDMSRVVDIPAEYLMVISLKKEGANYEGISMLRPCYGNWFRKDHYMKMNAIGIERFAIPTPVVTVPAGAQGTDQFANMQNVLESYTTHQSNYLTIPEGWTLIFNTNVYDPEKVEKSIDSEDMRMSKAFLANLLELGIAGRGGAYALGDSLAEFFLGSIKHLGQLPCDAINKIIIPRWIKLNFGPQTAYPKLKISGIDDKIGEEFSRMFKEFADAQYITPDDQLEEHLRKRTGVPKMSKIGQRKVEAKGALGEGAGGPGVSNEIDSGADYGLAERIRRRERRRLNGHQLAELDDKARKAETKK